uniref:Carboxypeptidase n=1 Tax=Solanum tuberosum TaxID=4113 RepID=M1CNC5_SOLTU
MARICITTLLNLKEIHQRIQLFFGLMVDLAVQALMALSMSMVSNIIYLDAPVGVGLSYSNDKADYNTGDLKTASDTHSFLLKWFEIYPEFLTNQFYISGESYAGIYVPTLASDIAKGIDAGVKPAINFKEANAACQGNFYNETSQHCKDMQGKINRNVDDLNTYDILEPCYHNTVPDVTTDNSRLPMSFRKLGETKRPFPVRKRMFGRAWPYNAPVREGLVPSWPEILKHTNYVPCIITVIGRWRLCSNKLIFTHDTGSMIPYHKNLTAWGYRALIYSYTQGYANNLTFLTIKGAGHTVPEYKPLEALEFYEQGAPQGALVTQIPGFTGKLLSKHYAGYVNLDESHGKNMYYYFIESERNPSKDPVVLWLNGGPGCSSFDGFVYEHGPFNFELGKANGSLPILHNNPYSWSKVSNIIYLDSPVGVGLSYSKNKADYNTGDLKTATETHAFLLKWFEIYPEFLTNPFYISGESYAGIYVPTLASEVVKGIDAKVTPVINFKDATAACKGDFYISSSQNCTLLLLKISQKVMGLNIYDILEPCYHTPYSTKNSELPMSFRKLGETERPLPVRTRMFGRAWPFNAPVREGLVPSWPELLDHNNVFCTDDTVATAWLNNEDVRKAIHAEPGSGHTVPEYKPQESLYFYDSWLQGKKI